MKLLQHQEMTLLAILRAERAARDEAERTQRLAEAQCWEEYLFTAFDQLTARLPRGRAGGASSSISRKAA